MNKWKYLKGSEKDFEGAPEWATECIWNDKEGESFCYWLSTKLKRLSFNGLVVEWDGEYGWRNYVKAQREPVTNYTLQDGVVFDAPIGMPLNEFRCRQQPITDEDDLNECIGATESITMNGKPLSDLSGAEYVTYNSSQFGIPSSGYYGSVKVGELHADGKEHVSFLGELEGTEALITERGNRYGKFKDGAKIMQSLKSVMRNTDGWSRLTDSQRESLDMIQHKIGRILNGDPAYDDNWKDIAGYSKLIADELNGGIK